MYKTLVFGGPLIFLLGVAPQAQAQAAGWTNWATPTQVDIVNAGTPGIMVYGTFGNPGNCTVADRFFVPKTDGQYAQVVAAVLAANVAGRQVRGYVSTCVQHLWYSAPTITYGNAVGDALGFKN